MAIRFTAARGKSYFSDIALDDISFRWVDMGLVPEMAPVFGKSVSLLQNRNRERNMEVCHRKLIMSQQKPLSLFPPLKFGGSKNIIHTLEWIESQRYFVPIHFHYFRSFCCLIFDSNFCFVHDGGRWIRIQFTQHMSKHAMISLMGEQHLGTFYCVILINNCTGIPLQMMRSS